MHTCTQVLLTYVYAKIELSRVQTTQSVGHGLNKFLASLSNSSTVGNKYQLFITYFINIIWLFWVKQHLSITCSNFFNQHSIIHFILYNTASKMLLRKPNFSDISISQTISCTHYIACGVINYRGDRATKDGDAYRYHKIHVILGNKCMDLRIGTNTFFTKE